MFLPNSSKFLIFITLYKAFLITEYESPADISETLTPSFCTCLTFEFINTVHLEPKSTGLFELIANLANSSIEIPSDLLNPSINEPQPDEQASFNKMLLITPSLIIKAFISCPPISKINSTLGINSFAPLKWQIVSISPISIPNAALINPSP